VDPSALHVCRRADLPNPNWLVPGAASAGQQSFGNGLLAAHEFVAIPSTVAPRSWNLIFVSSANATRSYVLEEQWPFARDPRLDPPTP
jgi:RES domain-containing protein